MSRREVATALRGVFEKQAGVVDVDDSSIGSPLMTLEERQEHQRQMWNAKTVEERNKLRDEHRKLMLERAKQQNYKLEEKQDDVFSVPDIPK